MFLVNRTRKTVLAKRLRIADSFFTRLRGLLGTRSLPEGEALLIRPCNSIHMLGMRYAIDVVFASAENIVLKTVSSLAPGRLATCSEAACVLELPCGTLEQSATEVGDQLEILDQLRDEF